MSSPQPVVYLHIGAMKTGTTFLQRLMISNRDVLATAGYLFPGARWYEQDRAVRDILSMARKDPPMRALCEGMWDKLAEQMLAHRGRASILSMEFLSFASVRQAAGVIGSLHGAEVHVVLTVRDAVGALPAQWQTHSRNGGTVSWPTFARSARRGARFGRLARGQGARVFEMAQGIPRILRVWGKVVPADRLHVITVPPSGSDPRLLWERFASVVGVDATVCAIPAENSNPSLGQPSAELMRLINAKLGKLPPSQYQPTLKAQLATKILTVRSGFEPGAVLDPQTRAFAMRWNLRVRKAIARSGSHLVGDPSDLPVESPDAEGPQELSEPSDEDVLAAAATARDGLLRLIRRRQKRLRKQGDDRLEWPGIDTAAVPTPQDRWRDHLDAAVDELACLVRAAIELHQQVTSGSSDTR
ncbi:MAG: hypothetical protein M3393_06375 [Actinomycetota bacterium]|nr:hypothetical protein [Actinomycetota bacterium]